MRGKYAIRGLQIPARARVIRSSTLAAARRKLRQICKLDPSAYVIDVTKRAYEGRVVAECPGRGRRR